MIRNTIKKTALMSGIASAMLIAAPAFAQDVPQTQDPAQQPPAAEQPQSVTLQPGATVKGSDGATLGTLVGAHVGASGQQELTVRGSDGQVRSVPLAGLTQQGADVVVGWTAQEFQASPPVAADDAAPAATPDAATPPADEPTR